MTNRITAQLADVTGRSPGEIELMMGAAAAAACAVAALRTINFLVDLGSAAGSSRSSHGHKVAST
jgi:hypothetical protein